MYNEAIEVEKTYNWYGSFNLNKSKRHSTATTGSLEDEKNPNNTTKGQHNKRSKGINRVKEGRERECHKRRKCVVSMKNEGCCCVEKGVCQGEKIVFKKGRVVYLKKNWDGYNYCKVHLIVVSDIFIYFRLLSDTQSIFFH